MLEMLHCNIAWPSRVPQQEVVLHLIAPNINFATLRALVSVTRVMHVFDMSLKGVCGVKTISTHWAFKLRCLSKISTGLFGQDLGRQPE